ncbi:MAG: septum site-determining protein MinC [Sporomusaceae bacterium]|jgi:septum site-determining protein MinC|nr:septum site-determining protein MinC [Sporomusaceae bacterium]
MRESVIFKGDRDGLQLILNASFEFGTIIEQLKTKLLASAKFFAGGAKVNIISNNGAFSAAEQKQLSQLLENYGLCYNDNEAEENTEELVFPEGDDFDYGFADASLVLTEYTQTDDDAQILTVPKMMRGGQKLIYSGTVIVNGNVNPNAQIIAGGDIIVHGTCWGIVHAGAFGDNNATITADKLLATQLRIAGLIARAPDTLHKPQQAETARILNGKLIIEPLAHQSRTA